jgi:hypothetical protein
MTNPSWKQLAAIPESLLKTQILGACGIEPPPEGISNTWRDDRLYMLHCPAKDTGAYWVVSTPDVDGVAYSCLRYQDASAALAATGTKPGTPTGDALRQWMRSKGWIPRGRAAISPTANTKAII